MLALPSILCAGAVGLQGWLMRGSPPIGLLEKQPLSAALLPGETRRLHVAPSDRQRKVLIRAVEHDFGIVAMQLITPGGNVASVAPLLEVVRISDLDTIGSFVDVRCVGRSRLHKIATNGKALVSPFGDTQTSVEEARLDAEATGDLGWGLYPDLAAVAHSVEDLHGSCYELHKALTDLEVGGPVGGREAATDAVESETTAERKTKVDGTGWNEREGNGRGRPERGNAPWDLPRDVPRDALQDAPRDGARDEEHDEDCDGAQPLRSKPFPPRKQLQGRVVPTSMGATPVGATRGEERMARNACCFDTPLSEEVTS